MKRPDFQRVLRKSAGPIQAGLLLACLGLASVALGAANPPPLPPTPSTSAPPALPPSLRDIKGPIAIDSPWLWLLGFGLLLILAALIGLAWWWWQRRHPAEPEPGIQLSPADRARQRLLASLGRIEEADHFTTEVSEIARTYLEEQFGLQAPDRTTEEFLAELSGSVALDSRHKTLLADFLTRCDLVKFARAEADRSDLQALHDAAQRLVDETSAAMAPPPTLTTPSR